MASSQKVLLLALLVYGITAWFSSGFNQSDEHFQILEFAAYHLGINTAQDLAWEYHEQMRPGLQPLMVYALHRVMRPLGLEDPFIIPFLLRLLSGLFTIGVGYLLYQTWKTRMPNERWHLPLLLLSLFLWCVLYNGVRFNSEHWSGYTFALAVGLFWYWDKPSRLQYLALGGLVGLSFLFRYQVAFMVAGWGLWLLIVHRPTIDKTLLFTLGGLALVATGILIDRWLYGEWTVSAYNYFVQNIVEDKASLFGKDPWWAYFSELVVKGIPPFGLLYLLAFLWAVFRHPKSLITWLVVPFVGIHILIAHKELRFLYPLLPFLPLVLAQFIADIYQQLSAFPRLISWGKRLFWAHNGALVVFVMFWSIIPEMSLYKTLYYRFPDPVTIFGIDDHPYRLAFYHHYYRRPGWCIMEAKTLAHLPDYGEPYLVAVDRKKMHEWPTVPGKKTLVYSSYPDWIWKVNFNNWLKRSQWWLVYYVEPEK